MSFEKNSKIILTRSSTLPLNLNTPDIKSRPHTLKSPEIISPPLSPRSPRSTSDVPGTPLKSPQSYLARFEARNEIKRLERAPVVTKQPRNKSFSYNPAQKDTTPAPSSRLKKLEKVGPSPKKTERHMNSRSAIPRLSSLKLNESGQMRQLNSEKRQVKDKGHIPPVVDPIQQFLDSPPSALVQVKIPRSHLVIDPEPVSDLASRPRSRKSHDERPVLTSIVTHDQFNKVKGHKNKSHLPSIQPQVENIGKKSKMDKTKVKVYPQIGNVKSLSKSVKIDLPDENSQKSQDFLFENGGKSEDTLDENVNNLTKSRDSTTQLNDNDRKNSYTVIRAEKIQQEKNEKINKIIEEQTVEIIPHVTEVKSHTEDSKTSLNSDKIIPQIETNISSHEIDAKTSQVKVSVSKIETKTSEVKVQVPKIESKTSEVKVSVSKIENKASEVKVSVSKIENKTSEVKVLASKIETKTSEVKVQVPKIETKTSEIKVDSKSENVVSNTIKTNSVDLEIKKSNPIIEPPAQKKTEKPQKTDRPPPPATRKRKKPEKAKVKQNHMECPEWVPLSRKCKKPERSLIIENPGCGDQQKEYLTYSKVPLLYKIDEKLQQGVLRIANTSAEAICFLVTSLSLENRYEIEPSFGKLNPNEYTLVHFRIDKALTDAEVRPDIFKIETIVTQVGKSSFTCNRRLWMNTPPSKIGTSCTKSILIYEPTDPFFMACLGQRGQRGEKRKVEFEDETSSKVKINVEQVLQEIQLAQNKISSMRLVNYFHNAWFCALLGLGIWLVIWMSDFGFKIQ